MKRRRLYTRHRLSRDAERLAWLATGLADSGSRAEDAFWEGELTVLIDKLLQANDEEAFNQALDRLYETHSRAYDELADLIEAGAETSRFDVDGEPHAGLLLALPVLAWSRYAIPTRSLPKNALSGLRAHLAAHVLADGCRFALIDYLFSPDQLPRGYGETRRLAAELWPSALQNRDYNIEAKKMPETAAFVSDVRYILAAVSVPVGRPLFRWNEPDGDREKALAQWREQGAPNLQSVMAGCAYELLLPDAYFAAWRQADREIRPYSLRAAVAYLQTVLGTPAGLLRAVIAPFYDRWLVEYRIGFALSGSDDLVHGVVWPLLGTEEETGETPAEIERILREAGVGEVILHSQRFPLEYCDDCGAPLYPNPEGESVHAEMPEGEEGPPAHLH
ncbi:uncharacterized protein DUF2863 [Sulfuritortus calidifontis]|uniref:Uncharacterized protein DUF2863 n=1 Tax=Sulfuritortus calidifontis TaxID=1914471 RepID=A0A4R3JY31_9PROT|nr:DUF2863 family protein [Sulfuritortus calidifontis]TCS73427.1 uncharacterized protein DUF2863 [Sulfuritortus calidifontis]